MVFSFMRLARCYRAGPGKRKILREISYRSRFCASCAINFDTRFVVAERKKWQRAGILWT